MTLYDQKLQRVCEYIQQHLDDELDLDTLSQVASLSKFHFHRIFLANIGVNLMRFIQLSRLKRASFQLAFSADIKIIDIALQSGFESPEAFSRAFKRSFDQTQVLLESSQIGYLGIKGLFFLYLREES